jgi:hypothetical protein
MGRLPTFVALTWTKHLALAAAVVYLARGRWRLAWIPIDKLVRDLQRFSHDTYEPNPSVANTVAWALATAAAHVPWRADCLIRAIAASLWSRNLSIPCEIHVGVRKDEEKSLDAHAWTISGSCILSGDIANLSEYQEFSFRKLADRTSLLTNFHGEKIH